MNEQSAAIMLHGHPFKPEQIISAIEEHPQVKQASIKLIKNNKGRNHSIAFVVLKKNDAASIIELRAFSKTKLYPQLVPDFFIIHTEDQKPHQGRWNINLIEQGFQPPRDATDILLLEIWTDLLERTVGIDDDFFAEGGHSLLAVDLLSRIEKATGQSLPLSTMLTKSTIRALANTLVHGIAPAVEGEIVELQRGRGGVPLFFLHGDYTGGGFFTREIAQNSDLDGPFYVVQPYGLGRTENLKLPESIEEMAAEHLKQIRLKQPNGPYRLAGHCNGGMVAFEIAQQLLKSGEKVEFLGMIAPLSATENTNIKRRIANAADNPDDNQEMTEESSLPEKEDKYRKWLRRSYFRMGAKYQASNYDGHLSIILLSGTSNKTDPTLGWAAIAKDSIVHQFSNKIDDHLRAIQQNGGAVGKLFSSEIARLQEQQ